MTPDQIPFFGGTYFPPAPRFNMPSFPQILTSVAEAYRERRDEIMRSSGDTLGEMRRVGILESTSDELSSETLDAAYHHFEHTFDTVNGGFGGAPKFPSAMVLEFLLRYYDRTGEAKALEISEFTCKKMANGGIYDQLGGGFHRYTVDANWLTPHFEKMLYDNAQLIRVYLHLYQITKDDFYKTIAVESLDYVSREMLDAEGGFYSAQDADSEGVEGKFFAWKPAEIREILGETDESKYFEYHYDVSADGNFEGKNILNARRSIEVSAKEFGISPLEFRTSIENSRELLFAKRETRIKPFRDEKVLTAWNGLMLGTYAEAAAILDSDEYLVIAKHNADFLLNSLQDDARLLRTWKEGEAKLNGYLEDYANLADGLFDLFQITGETKYLRASKHLADQIISEFIDEESGGFYFTSKDHEELLVRSKDYFDNATPSGNSVAVDILLKLSKVFGDENYDKLATDVLRLVGSQIKRFPGGFGRALSALEFYFAAVKEIVILGEKGNEFEAEIWNRYLPGKVLVPARGENIDEDFIPLLRARNRIDGKDTAFICENFTCKRPVTDVTELKQQLRQD